MTSPVCTEPSSGQEGELGSPEEEPRSPEVTRLSGTTTCTQVVYPGALLEAIADHANIIIRHMWPW